MAEIANKTRSVLMASDTVADLPPAVGKYRPQRILGHGATGVVYLAQDTLLERVVALKVLETHGTRQLEDRQRFLQEARAVAQLTHPQIVGIYEVDECDGRPYIAMEWMEGGSVQQALDLQGAIDWRQATAWMLDACAAVTAVHNSGMLHRDIKPGNLLLTKDGRIKLGDFGLVKLTAGTHLVTTLTHGPKGTPSFMSPEQCRAEPLDETADIYSLGATYYALLTGRAPYEADSPLGVMFAHCSSPPPDLAQTHPELPVGCSELVQRAMAKAPEERFASVSDFAAALAEIDPATARLPARRLGGSSGNRRRTWALFGAAAALLATTLGAPSSARRPWQTAKPIVPNEPVAAHAPDRVPLAAVSAAEIAAPASPAPDKTTKQPDPAKPLLPGLKGIGGHRGKITDMDFHRDGDKVIAVGEKGALAVWDTQGAKKYVQRLVEADPPKQKLYALGYFPRDQWVVTGGDDGELVLWDLISGQVKQRAPHQHGAVRSLDVAANGRAFLTGGDVGWNHWTIAQDGTMTDHGSVSDGLVLVHTVRYSPIQKIVAAASGNGIVTVHSLAYPRTSSTLNESDQALAFAFARARCELAYATRPGKMTLGSTSPRVAARGLTKGGLDPLVLEFAPNRRLLAVGEEQGAVTLFDLDGDKRQRYYTGHEHAVTAIRFSPDGDSLALGDAGGFVRMAQLPPEMLSAPTPKSELALDLAANLLSPKAKAEVRQQAAAPQAKQEAQP